MMLPKIMPALQIWGQTRSKKAGCLLPIYRDAGVSFAQGLYRADNLTDREFYDACNDAMIKLFQAKNFHPVILVTVSKTIKKNILKLGAKKTESADQFVIGE